MLDMYVRYSIGSSSSYFGLVSINQKKRGSVIFSANGGSLSELELPVVLTVFTLLKTLKIETPFFIPLQLRSFSSPFTRFRSLSISISGFILEFGR